MAVDCITVLAQSHLDHGLTPQQIAFVLDAVRPKIKEISTHEAEHGPLADPHLRRTVDLPADLGTVPSGIYGPVVGDHPVEEEEVFYAKRGDRQGDSRLVDKPHRSTNKVTIIAGPHTDFRWALYTMFGGPLAPKEPATLNRQDTAQDHKESREFWAVHALSSQPPGDAK
jgi:hypothetical protein